MLESIKIILLALIFTSSSDLMGLELPKKMTQTKDDPNIFENQGMFHSTYLKFENDSLFVYYSIYEGGYDLTLGKYTKKNDTMTFNWDEHLTLKAAADTNIYYKYFKYSTPESYPINNIKYLRKNDTLKQIE